MGRCVVIGGADIADYDRIAGFLRADDFLIFCDSGLKHREALAVKPDLIIGDVDSFENPKSGIETIVLPTVKDDTDTVYAVKEALKRGFDDFLLTGTIGGRIDHTLGNISILLMLDSMDINAVMVDDYSEVSVVSRRPAYIEDSYRFFSLLNISGKAVGITIRNAKYPLENGEINCDYQYGVSNEVLPGSTAMVGVEDGRLLLVKVVKDIDPHRTGICRQGTDHGCDIK